MQTSDRYHVRVKTLNLTKGELRRYVRAAALTPLLSPFKIPLQPPYVNIRLRSYLLIDLLASLAQDFFELC